MTTYDVAIVGGGLVGCSAALHLRRRNASVVLLERNFCGSQASGVNYGGVRQQGRELPELPIARRSRRMWAELPSLVGSDCEFSATGHFIIARSESDLIKLQRQGDAARRFGLSIEIVKRDDILRKYPWMNQREIAGGSLCAEDGQANPRLATPAFARAARALGADIREGVEVRSVTDHGHFFELETASGGTVRSIFLINAAGAWGKVIAAQFGETVPEDVLSPNMFVTEPIPHFITPNLGVVGGDVYIRQIPRGNVIIGGGIGVNNIESIRTRPVAEVTMEAARLAVRLVPRLANAHIIRSWSGIEGIMPDKIPVIGPSMTTPRLFHAFGFCGHGFQLAPAVGAILAELVLDGTSITPIDAFTIGRFANRPRAHALSG
jgi:sarcosine oxidase, subunit beta